MANPIQRLVSKKKRRYQTSGFDLDLTFITNNIIAMGFPAEKIEGLYRNHIDNVAAFLEARFSQRYFVFNLCSEREYPAIKFQNRVKKIPFDDHNPPKFTQIGSFCEAAKNWLDQGDDFVIAVHCKAGKGRTGVMICCYLIHANIEVMDAQEALQFYDEKRTSNNKGVTIPSQRRYVHYYGHYLHMRRMSENVTYSELSLYLTAIHLEGIQQSNGIGGCTTVYFTVHEYTSKLLTSNIYDLRRSGVEAVLDLDNPAAVQGDVKVEFFSKTPLGKERLFHCWFNTFFVIHSPTKPEHELPAAGLTRSFLLGDGDCIPLNNNNNGANGDDSPAVNGDAEEADSDKHHLTLTFLQAELDRANKDKTHSKFPIGFKMTLHFVCKGCHLCSALDSRRQNGSVPRPGPVRPTAGPGPSVSSSFHLASAPTRPVVTAPRRATSAASAPTRLLPRHPTTRRPHAITNPNCLVPPTAGLGHEDSDANDDHLSETDPEDEDDWNSQTTWIPEED